MLEAFREDPQEFSRDLAAALDRHGVAKPGALADRWHGGRMERKLEVLQENLPPHQQQMFALRDPCCLTSDGIVQRVQFLESEKYGLPHAEFLATSLGYATAANGPSPLAQIPSDPAVLRQSAKLFTDRTTDKSIKKGPRDRTMAITKGLYAQARRARMKLTPSGTIPSLDVKRLTFRIQLMQALVRCGHTVESAVTLGMVRSTAHTLFAKHQVGYEKYKDRVRHPEIDTVNAYLRLLRSFPESQYLSQEYLRMYRHYGEYLSIYRLIHNGIDTTEVAKETDGSYGSGEKHRRASVEMLARAAGVKNLHSDRALEDPESKECQTLRSLLADLGAEGKAWADTQEIARALLRARKHFQSVIWFGAVTRR